jgi:hypothetical protein
MTVIPLARAKFPTAPGAPTRDLGVCQAEISRWLSFGKHKWPVFGERRRQLVITYQ